MVLEQRCHDWSYLVVRLSAKLSIEISQNEDVDTMGLAGRKYKMCKQWVPRQENHNKNLKDRKWRTMRRKELGIVTKTSRKSGEGNGNVNKNGSLYSMSEGY